MVGICRRFSIPLVLVLGLSLLGGCAGSTRHANRGIQPDPTASERVSTEASSQVWDLYLPSDSADALLSESATDSQGAVDPEQAIVEAEALYANGVAANLTHRWHDAQVAFERAISLLSDIDLASVSAERAERIESLTAEISTDYQTTLAALGKLDEDATSSAVILRFETMDTTAVGLPAPGGEEIPPQVTYDFPVELNDQVRRCILYYQTVAREPFERFLVRAGRYLPLMREIVASYGIPTDLAYLPFVESGFNNRAYSYAHASGPWQFIASTGKRYGLMRTSWLDERRDFEKSTHAACRYLSDLYKMFRSWTLALASYNGGEGRVSRQIARQKTTNFWKLRLRDQTRNYVPLFMAALLIAKEPEGYGFHVEPDPPLEYDWVATNKPLEIREVARALGCDEQVLLDLNPELRRGVTPPNVAPYRFRVPKGNGAMFSAVYRDLPASRATAHGEHVVRKGETLEAIARKYGTTVTELVALNRIKVKDRLRIGQTLTVPSPARLAEREPAADRTATKKSASRASASGQYTVRRGDTLWELAKRWGTTTSAIRQTNRMGAHDKLQAGQRLVIPGRDGLVKNQDGGYWYTVRRGDTILQIATRFGLSIGQLIASNSLGDPDQIRVGQRLHIPKDL